MIHFRAPSVAHHHWPAQGGKWGRQVALAGLVTLCALASTAGHSAGLRGALVEPPTRLGTLTRGQIDSATTSAAIRPLTGSARCDVDVWALHYQTVGTLGEDASASGVLLLPGGDCANVPSALVAYGKGTDVEKGHTLADLNDKQTLLLAAFFAAQGYAVVATDYLGFAKSSYAYHPYLHAESEASAVIDSLRAARKTAQGIGAKLTGHVFLTGYSQGGHASMAAQRAMERDNPTEFALLGGAHLAGPYNLSGALKASTAGMGAQLFVPYFITSAQKAYGDVYGNVNDVFAMPYALSIENLLPNATLSVGSLVSSGALPGAQGESPDQALNQIIFPAYRQDMQNNLQNGAVRAALRNDLLDWSPQAPALLCGGSGDPTVPPRLHQGVVRAAWERKGLQHVRSVDVDDAITLIFGIVRLVSPSTFYESYHASLEPAFCLAEAKDFLDGQLNSATALAADIDTVFGGAERTYSVVFNPAAPTTTVIGYRYRQYGSHYLAVNTTGPPRVFYLGPLSAFNLLDLGPLSQFLAQAR